MSKIHLIQPGFRYKAYGPFTKNKARIKSFTETGNSQYIYQNELDKACFQQDMTCGDFTCLNGGTASGKVLRDKAFNISKDTKYDRYLNGLNSMAIHFLIKKLRVVLLKNKLCKISNQLKNYSKKLLENYTKTTQSTLIFYGQYFECWSCRYTIDK